MGFVSLRFAVTTVVKDPEINQVIAWLNMSETAVRHNKKQKKQELPRKRNSVAGSSFSTCSAFAISNHAPQERGKS